MPGPKTTLMAHSQKPTFLLDQNFPGLGISALLERCTGFYPFKLCIGVVRPFCRYLLFSNRRVRIAIHRYGGKMGVGAFSCDRAFQFFTSTMCYFTVKCSKIEHNMQQTNNFISFTVYSVFTRSTKYIHNNKIHLILRLGLSIHPDLPVKV